MVFAFGIVHEGEDSMTFRWVEEGEPSTHPLEEKPRYVRAIGMVSLEAIALELRMGSLMARTVGLPTNIARAIYLTPKSEQARIDIFRNAAKARLHVSPSKRNTALGKKKARALRDVMKIIERAETLIRTRHRVIHDDWNVSDDESKVTRRILDGGMGREHIPASLKELKTLIRDMRVIIDNAYELARSFKDDPPYMANLRKSSTKDGS